MSAFVITDIGLERAAQANKQGISLTIAKFVVGSAFGYTPLPSDTKIHGDYLYESTPISFKYVGNHTIQITCNIPEEVGPFSWGEVGLYLDSGELFAIAALPKPQNKYSSIESEIASSVTFYCYLTLAYNKVSITIDYGENPNSIVEIIDAFSWSSIKKPSEYDQNISEIIVHELSPNKDATLLVRSNDDKWSISSTYQIAFFNVVPVTSTKEYLEFPISENILAGMASNTPSMYVAQFPDGTFASFSKVTVAGSNLRFTYTDQLEKARERESQIYVYSASDLGGNVSYSKSQTLTTAEKARARLNIGAISQADVTGVVKYDAVQQLNTAQKTQARNNIDAASKADLNNSIAGVNSAFCRAFNINANITAGSGGNNITIKVNSILYISIDGQTYSRTYTAYVNDSPIGSVKLDFKSRRAGGAGYGRGITQCNAGYIYASKAIAKGAIIKVTSTGTGEVQSEFAEVMIC